MAARVCKNLIRALLREKMKELKVPSSEPYRQLVLALFNIFAGNSPHSPQFWISTRPPHIDGEPDTNELKGGLEYYIERVYFFLSPFLIHTLHLCLPSSTDISTKRKGARGIAEDMGPQDTNVSPICAADEVLRDSSHYQPPRTVTSHQVQHQSQIRHHGTH